MSFAVLGTLTRVYYEFWIATIATIWKGSIKQSVQMIILRRIHDISKLFHCSFGCSDVLSRTEIVIRPAPSRESTVLGGRRLSTLYLNGQHGVQFLKMVEPMPAIVRNTDPEMNEKRFDRRMNYIWDGDSHIPTAHKCNNRRSCVCREIPFSILKCSPSPSHPFALFCDGATSRLECSAPIVGMISCNISVMPPTWGLDSRRRFELRWEARHPRLRGGTMADQFLADRYSVH